MITLPATFRRGALPADWPANIWVFGNSVSGTFGYWATQTAPDGWGIVPTTAIPNRPADLSTHNFDITNGNTAGPCLGFVPDFIWVHFDPGDPTYFGSYGGILPTTSIRATVTRSGFVVTLIIVAGPTSLISNEAVVDWGDGNTEILTLGPVGAFGTVTAIHTFSGPSSSTGIFVSVVPIADYVICGGGRMYLSPEAIFTFISDDEDTDNLVFFDASGSYDIDGTIVSYVWVYGGAGVESGTPPIMPDYTYDIAGTKIVTLTVTDNDGLTDSVTHNNVLAEEVLTSVGVCYDMGIVLHSAVRSGANTSFYRIPTDTATKTLTSTLTGVKPISLWRQHALLLFAGQEAGGSFSVWRSIDFARTWTKNTMASIWNPSTYTRADVTGLVNGGAVSVAVTKGSSPLTVRFKFSGDGITWPTDTDSVLVVSYSGSAKQFRVEQKPEQSILVVTNGVDFLAESNDYGRTWNPV